MKVIDLLNKIAKGEDVPEYIKYINRANSQEEKMLCCKENIIYKLDQLIIGLNDEIIEEVEDKEYEDIEEVEVYHQYDTALIKNYDSEFIVNLGVELLADKINQLIRNQQKIIEQLEKK